MITYVSNLVDRHYAKFDDARSQHHVVALVIIMLIAFALRMMGAIEGQGYHYFAIGDEMSAYSVAINFLNGDPRAYYIGQPTFANGFVPGPFWTLFWIFIYKIGGSTVHGAMIAMTLVNIATVYLFYLFSRKFLSPAFSLYSTLFFATAPWPVYFSAGVWNPFALAFLGVLLFLALWNTINNDNSRQVFFVAVLSAIIPQFHMIGIFYIPAILLLLYLAPVKISRRWLVIGIVAGICVYLPYLIGEALNNWENTKNMTGNDRGASASVLKIITAPMNVLSNFPGRWAGEGFSAVQEFGNARFGSVYIMLAFNLASIIVTLTIVSSFVRKFFRHLRLHRLTKQAFNENPMLVFLGVLLIVPPLLFLVTGHNYASRYTILIFPLLFLLPALFLNGIIERSRRLSFGLVTVALMIFNIYLAATFFSYQGKMIETADFFMPSFDKIEKIRQILVSHAGKDVKIIVDHSAYIDTEPKEKHLAKQIIPAYVSLEQRINKNSLKFSAKKTYYLVQLDKYDILGLETVFNGNGIAITTQKPTLKD